MGHLLLRSCSRYRLGLLTFCQCCKTHQSSCRPYYFQPSNGTHCCPLVGGRPESRQQQQQQHQQQQQQQQQQQRIISLYARANNPFVRLLVVKDNCESSSSSNIYFYLWVVATLVLIPHIGTLSGSAAVPGVRIMQMMYLKTSLVPVAARVHVKVIAEAVGMERRG